MLRKTLIIIAMLIIFSTTVVCGLSGSEATPEPTAAAEQPPATQEVEPTQPPVEEDVEEVATPTPEPATPTPEPTPTEVIIEDLSAQEAYDLALAEALAWQSDAVLNEMQTSLLGPLDAKGKSKGWAVKFWSTSAKEINSMIFANGQLNASAVPSPVEGRTVPDLDAVNMDTKSMYDAAAAAGGDKYLTAGYVAMASLVPYPLDLSVPTWYFNFQHPQKYTLGFTVIIDARSGEVIQAIPISEPEPVETAAETGSDGSTATGADTSTTGATDFTDPVSVVQTIFDAAKSGEFTALENLCDPQGENDNDTQMICDLATTDTERDSFIEFFEKGQINGDAQVSPDGAEAEVPFLFGPDGDNEETMGLINRDGQWYLFGF